jgi:glycosyltransferase involved in cell wall biosynthesis
MFTISVFAKNEEENIPFVVDRLLARYDAGRMVFVLDGDIESTARILTEKGIRFIQGPGRGKGAAIRFAIRSIDSELLVFMDADGSHDPDEIGGLLEPLMNDGAEMVIGSRFLGSSEELHGSMSDRLRYAGNVSGNCVINALWNRTGTKITDAQNGFRSIKRRPFLALALEEDGFSIEQEMVIKCLKNGYRIREVPSFERKRRCGSSHISSSHFFRYAACVVRNILK